jgi:hypothetical protein
MTPPSSEFVPTNALEEALVHAARDPAARARFYEVLLESTVLLLTPEPPGEEGSRTLQKDETVKLVTMAGADRRLVPFFSSRQALELALGPRGRTQGFLAMGARDAFALLSQGEAWAVLNPGLAYGKEFTTTEIRALTRGSFGEPDRRRYEKETRVLLGEPAEYPHRLVELLTRIFASHPGIEAAYLAHFSEPERGEPAHPLIGILGQIDDAVMRESGLAAEAVSTLPVDFVRIDPGATRGVSTYFLRESKPFYRRSTD